MQKRIRSDRGRLEKIRSENDRLQLQIRKQKMRNEYLIRGIVRNYWQAQYDLLHEIDGELSKIQSRTYLSLKTIRSNLERNMLPNLSPSKAYVDAREKIYLAIDHSKNLRKELMETQHCLKDEMRALIDKNYSGYRTHGRLGGKSLVRQILSQNREALLVEFEDCTRKRFFKKDATGPYCEQCYCPMMDNWASCPNCGERFDPYSLQQSLEMIART